MKMDEQKQESVVHIYRQTSFSVFLLRWKFNTKKISELEDKQELTQLKRQ